MTSTYQYDGLNRATRLHDVKGTTAILDNQYIYNTANQIAQKSDLAGTHAFGYDAVNRLISASHPSASTENYSYQAVGNRTAATGINSTSYTYGAFNRLTSTNLASYSYDNNGNLTSKTVGSVTTQYTWDFENRLTQVTMAGGPTVNYKYDALGRRIQRSTSDGNLLNFVYDGIDVIQDLDGNDNLVRSYINGPGVDNKIRQTDATNGNLYYTTDYLGSTIALTDASGSAVEGIGYDSYGNSSGSALTRYTYTGREFDSDTGLYYDRARWYDSQVGRFISEDPIGLSGGSNLYTYVDNNALMLKDPLGLCPQKPLPTPQPQPAPSPTPDPNKKPDPCRDRPWSGTLQDWREIAKKIGWGIGEDGKAHDEKFLSFDQIEKNLKSSGFGLFPWYKPQLDPLHWGAEHYEGDLRPNEPFHVMVYGTDPSTIMTAKEFRDQPARNIEVHCEPGYEQPSSILHAVHTILP